MKKYLKMLTGLILILICVLLYKYQPNALKRLLGNARSIGKPIDAIVYTNGHINNEITVYHYDNYWGGEKADDYLLNLKEFDKFGMLRYINIDLNRKWVGRSVATTDDQYYTVDGVMYQGEAGAHFVDFKDDMKGFNFDPNLVFNDKEVKFNVPPKFLNFDSVRIEFSRK